jgi:hypothetical protein
MPPWGDFLITTWDFVVVIVTWFALMEGPGLKPGKSQYTLSAWIRRKLGVSSKKPHASIAVAVFGIFCATLSSLPIALFIHIVWG